MNLATICWHLATTPATYERLRKEILGAKPTFDSVQSLPYLRGVVQEGLRISMANPSRLPRVVPADGWEYNSSKIPAGTEVSCTPFELHFNEDVFPDAQSFKPERWLDATDEQKRDSIPFGLGPRQCIARNLATVELYCAVQRLVEEDLLRGAACTDNEIKILEWFNSAVIGHKIELSWA
jgi:cytochrome P450